MKNKAVTVLWWISVIVCMGVIFCFSAQPADVSQAASDSFAFLLRLPFGSFIVRKGAHFLEFAGLAVLVFGALRSTFGYYRPFAAFAVTAVYGVSDEIHQIFVEGRAYRFFDWTVDCSGAAAALIFICLIIFIFRKYKGGACDEG